MLHFAEMSSGWTALHHAAFIGSVSCARVLLRNGADPGIRDARGRTAADLSEIKGPFPTFRKLLEGWSSSDGSSANADFDAAAEIGDRK